MGEAKTTNTTAKMKISKIVGGPLQHTDLLLSNINSVSITRLFTASNKMAQKGKAIHILGGTYKGKSSWINIDKCKTAESSYVIIVMDDGTEVEKLIHDWNFDFATRRKPRSYAEAALQQHPDINLQLNKLCEALSMLKVDNDMPKMLLIFNERLNAAAKFQQSRKGKKAVYRTVSYGKQKEF